MKPVRYFTILGTVGVTSLSRGDVLMYARLCLRANLTAIALRCLHPFIRGQHAESSPATAEEKLVYGGCLAKLGLGAEARELLEDVDGSRFPEVYLYRTLAFVSVWDYEPTIALANTFLSSTKIDDYQRMVGQVNLAAALVHCRRHEVAEPLLRELVDYTVMGGYWLAWQRVQNLYAESLILQGEWETARTTLAACDERFATEPGLDSFFIRKWKAVLEFLEKPELAAREAMLALRTEAEKVGHWETIRDLDLFEGARLYDHDRLLHLYFGTPHEPFRRRIFEEFEVELLLPNTFHWEHGEGAETPRLDLSAGEWNGKLATDLGETQRRLLHAFCSDFYRPLPLTTLSAAVYPGEYYNPRSSPFRLHQAKQRLEKWFKQHRMPLTVETYEGQYRLAPKGAITIEVPRPDAPAIPWEIEQLRLKAPESFSAAEAAVILAVSKRTATRLVSELVVAGQLAKSGAGNRLTYSFVSAVRRAA